MVRRIQSEWSKLKRTDVCQPSSNEFGEITIIADENIPLILKNEELLLEYKKLEKLNSDNLGLISAQLDAVIAYQEQQKDKN